MKLISFVAEQGPHRGQTRVGAWIGDSAAGKAVDFKTGFEWLATQGRKVPPAAALDMVSFIHAGDVALQGAKALIEASQSGTLPAPCLHDAQSLKLLSPIPHPISMRDGYAFRQHVESARRNRGLPMIPEFDLFPVFYFTNHLAVTGPGELPVQKLQQDKLDFELEVAIVLGKGGRNIPAAQADEHIFGYTIMNDWSARAMQMEEMKLNLGPAKGKDFATSLGPWIVTRDELQSHRIAGPNGERYDLRMKAFVNDKPVSDGNVKDMNWTFGQILERASYGVTLHPGEVIGSGTVGTGCFLELNGSKITDNQWLKPGDRVVLEVDGLGRLENTIRDGGP